MSTPAYGRYQTPETYSSLTRLHEYDSVTPLKAVQHEPRVAVLDQSDLIAQNIIVSTFIPGAPYSVDALGSCTANATTAALSTVLDEAAFLETTKATSYVDTKGAEEFAIRFYHQCTDQTGNSAEEWPPTDCGSSGPFIVSELQKMKLISTDKITSSANGILSLLQSNGVLMGSPWFYAWEQPNASGFIDDGGIEAAIQSGVAGGHETLLWGISDLKFTKTGAVDTANTVLIGRNSWSATWGDAGNYLVHLNTLMSIASHCDWRQLVPVS